MQDLIRGLLPITTSGGHCLASASLLALLVIAAPAEEPPAALRSLLTPEEFHRAGLDKLTQDELDLLSAALARIYAFPPTSGPARPDPSSKPPRGSSRPVLRPAPVRNLPQGDAAFGTEEQLHAAVEVLKAVPSAIRSRVPGPFAGWSGQTSFLLENGQLWQQAEQGVFSVNLTNPAIVIENGLLGTFYLHVEGYGSRVKVKRVK